MSERSSNALLIAVIVGWAVLIVALLFMVLRPGGATTAACPAPASAAGPMEFHVHLGNDDFNTQQADTVNDTVNDTSSSRVTDAQTDSQSGSISESGLRPISVVVWNKPVNAQASNGSVTVDESKNTTEKGQKPKPTPTPDPEPTPEPDPEPEPDPSPTEGP